MARRATVIKQERANNDGILLVLDAGSTLTGQWISTKSKGQVMVEGMNLMGYDALTLGQMDLSAGIEALKEREQEANFPFLSANLISVQDGKPIFQPYVILERQDRRIAILGLTEPDAIVVGNNANTYMLLDPVIAAQRWVPQLREQADILIVLSHLGAEEDKLLAEAVPGIDIIIGGNTRQIMQSPDIVGNTLIAQQGYLGEWIGRFQATFDANGVPSDFIVEPIALTPDFEDDPELAAVMQKWDQLYPTPTPFPTLTPTPEP
ncbi:MAG: hypothetical protein GX552_05330 [Chloroflexi bacterium]|nr:hypothetical protein [Chloroflexota bacterium]